MSCVTKSISPCFETIKAVDGALQHLCYHQARLDETRQTLYDATQKISLASLLVPPSEGTFRIRVEYDSEVRKVEVIPYTPRKINKMALVESDIAYDFKYSDREALNALVPHNLDDVIITHNGVLKDTSIANIALLIDGVWKTPKEPLLKGTTRARLLSSGQITAEHLDRESIKNADKFAIMNALIGFKIIENVCIKE